ncbi:MAG: hypothetical protein EOO16_13985 [Chitinophagaceae bacterium]|nr:MAG: hypothetical protein EOO16_13985 [Chitinophagaceae bacterium]
MTSLPATDAAILQAAFDASTAMIQVFAALRDSNGTIAGFTCVLDNAAARRFFGSSLGLTVDAQPAGAGAAFGLFCEALNSGQPARREFNHTHGSSVRTYQQSVVKLNDCVVSTTTDITNAFPASSRATEEEVTLRTRALRAATDRFEAAIHVSPNVLSILRAERGADGAITDFYFEWISRSGAPLVGRDLTGERLLSAFPTLRSLGLFDRLLRTVATGEPTEHENFYDGGGAKFWASWKAVKFEDGLFISVENISARKEAEAKVHAQAHFINRVSALVPDIVMVTEMPSKRVIYCNRDHGEAAGFPGADLRHLSPQERDRRYQLHPEDASRLRHYYEGVLRLADGAVATLDYRARFGTGGWRWFRVRGAVFERAATGRVVAVLNVIQDITAQRQAEEELKAEHYFLEQVTDNTPHLVYVFDFDEQRYIYINRRIADLTGTEPEYVYGMGSHLFKKVLHPDDLGARIDYLQGLVSLLPGEIRDNEFRLAMGNGWRWFRSKDHIFKKENGAVRQVIGLAEDITYERMLREKVQGGQTGMN